jgi:PGF-CTERM protein
MSGLLAVLMITSVFVPVVVADSHEDESETTNRSYQIVQGDQVIQVDPLQGNESVEEFYDYRHPHVGSRDNPFWGRQFSSVGTTEFQEDDQSTLLLYEGPDGVSFVGLHDKYHEEQAEGTTGGSVSWTITGLPENGEWAVIDDEYGWLAENETKDDIFLLDSDHRAGAPGNDGTPPGDADALLSWVWLTGRSDGVAYRGLDQDVSVTIDPEPNRYSYHRYGDQRRPDRLPDRPDRGERYNGTLYAWDVVVPTGDGEFDRVTINNGQPIEIRSTSSPPAPRSVTLESENIEPGNTARVSAAIENTGNVDWTYDASFRVGDTELDTQTVTVPAGEERTVEFSQDFTEPGVYEIGVDDRQTTLTVGDPEPTTNSSATDSSNESTDEQLPGFGPVAGLVALVAVTIVARHRAA